MLRDRAHKRCVCMNILSEICKKREPSSGCFVLKLARFDSRTHTLTNAKRKNIEFSFYSYGWCVFHVCVCFLRPFSQMFQFKICVSLFLSLSACVCVLTLKTANLSLEILFTLVVFASFYFVLLLLSLLNLLLLFNLVHQICDSLVFRQCSQIEFTVNMEQEKHTKNNSTATHIALNIVCTAPQELNTQETLNWWWFDTRRGTTELNWQESESQSREKE